ncbi:hypothetical protein [Nocardia brasiliensis]|uniref:hypothetical protein n=1 Tax=Nocardia brasiliensis TaxID=37326 RepID=UPI0002526231|nr:hypothetical protein [Nocardia brasiliensis]
MTNSRDSKKPSNSDSAVAVSPNDTRVQDIFDMVKKCIVIFGVISAVVLATVAAIAAAHGLVNTFMWVRAGLLLLVTPLFYRLAVLASRGGRKSLERLRIVTTILPIAIVVVDLIPGVCPVWYAGMQAVSAVPLIVIAVRTRRVMHTALPAGA